MANHNAFQRERELQEQLEELQVEHHQLNNHLFPIPHPIPRYPNVGGPQVIEAKDGNGSGLGRVDSPRTRTRDPTTLPEPDPKPVTGEDLPPAPNPAGPRNPTGSPKPANFTTIVPHMKY